MEKSGPKLDIQIEHCGIRPKRYYTFEAKRLRDDDKASSADTLRHYLGEEGVGRFVADHYEPENVEAAMLGCVQARNAEYWLDLLSRTFAEDAVSGRNSLQVVKQFRRCSIIAEIPYEASTIHQRTSGSTIRLLHIFFDCM